MRKRLTLGTVSCAAMFCVATMAFGQSGSSADKSFVKNAMEGGKAEVALGQLAQEKAISADVKHFGERMVTDHSKLNEQMTPIAQSMGVTPPSGPSMTEKATEAKLKAKSGEEFDKAYIEDMLKDHRKDLAEFKKEAQTASDPQLKQAAEQGAKVISEHLRMAEDLAKNHNVSVASK